MVSYIAIKSKQTRIIKVGIDLVMCDISEYE